MMPMLMRAAAPRSSAADAIDATIFQRFFTRASAADAAADASAVIDCLFSRRCSATMLIDAALMPRC